MLVKIAEQELNTHTHTIINKTLAVSFLLRLRIVDKINNCGIGKYSDYTSDTNR